MKIAEPSAEILESATRGELEALDNLLSTVQPGIYNLAARMLGNREDAAEATQEILLKIVTHLSSFRGESAFSTWAWRVARNHLLTASTRSLESPEVSLEAMAERLQAGLDFADLLMQKQNVSAPLTPQDKLEARQVALACTQNMLMTLSREQRLVYILDTVFDLSSKEAAEIVGITPEAYRQRLSRARTMLNSFTDKTCGIGNTKAACQCEQQLPAMRHLASEGKLKSAKLIAINRVELNEAEKNFAAFARVTDAAALFRAHPEYAAPESMQAAIRAVLTQEGFIDPGRLQ